MSKDDVNEFQNVNMIWIKLCGLNGIKEINKHEEKKQT